MRGILPTSLAVAFAIAFAPPCRAQGTIPSWGEIAQPAEVRLLRQTIADQARLTSVNVEVLDRIARHVGGRYRSMGSQELVRRVAGLAQRLRDAERSEASLRASFARIPPSAREEIERAWSLIREGLLDDALRYLRRAETIALGASGVSSQDYARLVSLTANVLEMQQDPRGASDLIRSALRERQGAFRASQTELAEQTFQIELRWAREDVSTEAAARALQILHDFGLPDGSNPNLHPRTVDTRRSIFGSKNLRQCEVADLYFIRSAGRNVRDLRAGLERFRPSDLEAGTNGSENWECKSVLARLEVTLGIVRADRELMFRGLSRLDNILRYWGNLQACPLGFEDYGPAIYRLGIAVRDFAAREQDSVVTERAATYQHNLRYARMSLLPFPAPANLRAYLSEIGISPAH